MVMRVIVKRRSVESGEESVEDLLAPHLSFGGGVVALALQGGPELDGGHEEGAGFADRLEVAVELDGSGAVAVAEHARVHLGAELGASRRLRRRRAGWRRLVVEGFDLLGDGEVLVGDGAVGDAGVDQGHRHRWWPSRAAIASRRHAAVDGLGGQGVPQLVGVDVADPGGGGGRLDGVVDAGGGDRRPLLDEQQVRPGCQSGRGGRASGRAAS